MITSTMDQMDLNCGPSKSFVATEFQHLHGLLLRNRQTLRSVVQEVLQALTPVLFQLLISQQPHLTRTHQLTDHLKVPQQIHHQMSHLRCQQLTNQLCSLIPHHQPLISQQCTLIHLLQHLRSPLLAQLVEPIHQVCLPHRELLRRIHHNRHPWTHLICLRRNQPSQNQQKTLH